MDFLEQTIFNPYASVPAALAVGIALYLIKTVLFQLYKSGKEEVADVSEQVFDKIIGKKLDAADQAAEAVVDAADETAGSLINNLKTIQLNGGLLDSDDRRMRPDKPPWLDLSLGSVKVRLLPTYPGGPPKAYVLYRTHHFNGKTISCLRHNVTEGRWEGECPICEYYTELYKQADKLSQDGNHEKAERIKKKARELKPMNKAYYNCLVRDSKFEAEVGESHTGAYCCKLTEKWTPRVAILGMSLHRQIMEQVEGVVYIPEEDGMDADKQWKVDPKPVFNLADGYDLNINREILATDSYAKSCFDTEPSPICNVPEIAKWIMQSMTNLSQLICDQQPTIEEQHQELAIFRGYKVYEAYQKSVLDVKSNEANAKLHESLGIGIKDVPVENDVEEEKYPVGSFIIINDEPPKDRKSEHVSFTFTHAMNEKCGKCFKVNAHRGGGFPAAAGFTWHPDWIRTPAEVFPVGTMITIEKPEDPTSIDPLWVGTMNGIEGKVHCVADNRSGDGFPVIVVDDNSWGLHPDWCRLQTKTDKIAKIMQEWPVGTQFHLAGEHIVHTVKGHDESGHPTGDYNAFNEDLMVKTDEQRICEKFPIGTLVQIVKTTQGNIATEFLDCQLEVVDFYDAFSSVGKVILEGLTYGFSEDQIKKVSDLTLEEQFPEGSWVKIKDDLENKDNVNVTPDMGTMKGNIYQISSVNNGPSSGTTCIRLTGDSHYWHPNWVNRVGAQPKEWNELEFKPGVLQEFFREQKFNKGDIVYWVTKKGTVSLHPSKVYNVRQTESGLQKVELGRTHSDDWQFFWIDAEKCANVPEPKLVRNLPTFADTVG